MTTFPGGFTTGPYTGNVFTFGGSFATAAATLLQCFRDSFPEFAELDDLTVLQALAEAQCFASLEAFGACRYKLAVINYAAHCIFCSQQESGAGAGQLTSVKVGPMAKSFGAIDLGGEPWLGK